MTESSLRLRVFAGPNGSGKSTIIQAVREYRVKDIPVDFGVYINADDIAVLLRNDAFTFDRYGLSVEADLFTESVQASGLINEAFDAQSFRDSFSLRDNRLILRDMATHERLAQMVADFLRKQLLIQRKKFSFETVFSHSSKLDIMRQAAQAGYKVYLYFVSTESPQINTYRVLVRTHQGGHSVPTDKIISRYYRSLDLLYEAAQLAYQAYFFDNSTDGEGFRLFAHFKNAKGIKEWDAIDPSQVPHWFVKYYLDKVKREGS